MDALLNALAASSAFAEDRNRSPILLPSLVAVAIALLGVVIIAPVAIDLIAKRSNTFESIGANVYGAYYGLGSFSICGVAATKNIVKHFGYEPNSVDTLLKVTANAGVNLLDVKNALKSYNLVGRGFKTTIQEINTLPLPMIAHWEGNHFVVVETVHDNDITVIDPAIGRVRYSKSRFAEHWTGVALSVQRAPKQQ